MTRRSALRLIPFAAIASRAAAAEPDGASRTADFRGVPIHYESYGTGAEALVFIHGWTCDLTFWRGQAPIYTSHRSLLIDLPGHGRSGKPHMAYPMEFFARSVEAVIRDSGAEHATFVGHSLGGPIIYAFLRLFREKARAMALIDVDVRRGSAGPVDPKEQRARMARIARHMQGVEGDRAFKQTVESCFTAQTPDAVKAEVRTKMLATPKYVRIASVTSPSSLPAPGKDETFDLPAIAIQAGSPATEAHYRTMKTLFTNLELDQWNGSGHFLMMEDPERFNRALQAFLAKLPPQFEPTP